MGCHALLERRVTDQGEGYESAGNVLLDDLLGCEYDFRDEGPDMNAEARAHAEALRERGRKPYFIPGGGSNPTGALGYALAAAELVAQADAQGLRIDRIVHATGSAGTQAGLVAGLHAISAPIDVVGISVRAAREAQVANVLALARETAERIGVRGELPAERVEAHDDQVGPGYGKPTEAMVAAIERLAREEGIFLDPVYSGKGMAGLIALIERGELKRGQTVVFVHTGGSAGLFAYRHLFERAPPA